MKKCYIQNLAMIVTDSCNLNCAHCINGPHKKNFMSNEVIERTLNQIKGVDNISITGGEPTLALTQIEKIISYGIKNNIKLNQFTITTNAIIYSSYLLELLKEINKYIGDKEISAFLAISFDKYHYDEIKKRNLEELFDENIRKYQESKYFYMFRNPNTFYKEGNAEEINEEIFVPMEPIETIMTYINNYWKLRLFDKKNGVCCIGPVVAINPKGTITDCDASIIHQETIYNYGNVLTDTIEESCLRRNIPIVKPRNFDRLTRKIINKQWYGNSKY